MDTINLRLFTGSRYNGLPVTTSHGPLVEQYLEKTYAILQRSLASHQRLFAIRIDLRFPRNYWPLEGQTLGNDYLTRFSESLKAKIDHDQRLARNKGTRVHPACLRRIWAREYRREEDKPHFHLVILLNGAAYNALGHFGSGNQNMMSRITEAWASALGLVSMDARGLVQIPESAQYHVDLRSTASLEALFFRASYLCKMKTKDFGEGLHPFGCSRS